MINTQKILNYFSVAAIFLFFMISIMVLPDYGMNWDEPGNIYYGNLLLQYYQSGLQNKEVFSFSNLYYYGGLFDLTSSALAQWTNTNIIHMRHFLGVLIGTYGLWLAWWLGYRIAGAWAGFLCIITLASWPLYFGYAQMNGKDFPVAIAVLSICASIIWAFESWSKPKLKHFIALGLALAFAFSQRISTGITGVIFFAILMIFLLYKPNSETIKTNVINVFQFMLRLSPALLITVPIMNDGS